MFWHFTWCCVRCWQDINSVQDLLLFMVCLHDSQSGMYPLISFSHKPWVKLPANSLSFLLPELFWHRQRTVACKYPNVMQILSLFCDKFFFLFVLELFFFFLLPMAPTLERKICKLLFGQKKRMTYLSYYPTVLPFSTIYSLPAPALASKIVVVAMR